MYCTVYHTSCRITDSGLADIISTSSSVADEICHILSCVDIVFVVTCYSTCNATLAEITHGCKTK